MAECERDWDLHEIVSNGTYDFAVQVREWIDDDSAPRPKLWLRSPSPQHGEDRVSRAPRGSAAPPR